MVQMVFLAVTVSAVAQVDNPPPFDLLAYAGNSRPSYLEKGENRWLKANVKLDTMSKTLHIAWKAKAGAGCASTTKRQKHSLSFHPVSAVWSKQHPDELYIIGKNQLVTVLEKWSFGNYVLTASPGPTPVTNLSPPSETRTTIPIDQSLVYAWDIGIFNDDVWVMSYPDNTVYLVDADTGAKSHKIGGTQVAGYRSFNVRRHSDYGMVLIFFKFPWYVSLTGRPDPFGGTSVAAYDSDENGSIDGYITINWSDHLSNELWTTGSWLF